MENRVEIIPRLKSRHFWKFRKTDPSVRYHYYHHIHIDTTSQLESMPKYHVQLMYRFPLDMVSREKFGVQGEISWCGGFVDSSGLFVKLKLESI